MGPFCVIQFNDWLTQTNPTLPHSTQLKSKNLDPTQRSQTQPIRKTES